MPSNLVSKSQRLELALGGSGAEETVELVLRGCGCRTTDFQIALIAFAKEWRLKSDAAEAAKGQMVEGGKTGDCGCWKAKVPGDHDPEGALVTET